MPERRCDHGFLLSRVRCPVGCRTGADGQPIAPEPRPRPPGPVRKFDDATIAGVLSRAPSIRAATDELGAGRNTLRYRIRRSPELQALVAERRSIRGSVPFARHPAFVDMTGRTCGTWKVLSRADSLAKGNARWKCRHACGGVHVLEGIRLRHAPPKTCPHCRAGVPGQERARASKRAAARETA